MKVMKEVIGMKYKKVEKLPLHLNTPRNLILRQQWAMRFVKLFDQYNFINVDESWASESNFLRRKWQHPG